MKPLQGPPTYKLSKPMTRPRAVSQLPLTAASGEFHWMDARLLTHRDSHGTGGFLTVPPPRPPPHVLTSLLRVTSLEKNGCGTTNVLCYSLSCPKTPFISQKQQSIFAPNLSKPNGLIWPKALLSLVYQLSFSTSCHKKYFYAAN